MAQLIEEDIIAKSNPASLDEMLDMLDDVSDETCRQRWSSTIKFLLCATSVFSVSPEAIDRHGETQRLHREILLIFAS